MADLTDEQCDAFRRLPGSFNDMVRAIYRAGRESTATPPADAALADEGYAGFIADQLDELKPNQVLGSLQIEMIRRAAAALRARAVTDGIDLWSFLRDVLKRGAAIESQFIQQGYETFISEIESAARKEDERLRALLAASKAWGG